MQSLNGGAGSPYGCKARVQADSSQSPNDIYDHTLSLQLETMQARARVGVDEHAACVCKSPGIRFHESVPPFAALNGPTFWLHRLSCRSS